MQSQTIIRSDVEMDADEQQHNLPPRAAWSDIQWEWSQSDKDEWRAAPTLWQDFMKYWQDSSRAAELDRNDFPHTLTIFPSPPFNPQDMRRLGASSLKHTLSGTILVSERYASLYHGMNQWQQWCSDSGVLIAGQSGVGKSIFLWYLLVRLILDKQPVLLHLPQKKSVSSILFYDFCAWCSKDKDSDEFQTLPSELVVTETASVRRIVMLVDSPIEAKAPVGLNDASAWPIYAVSQNQERYHAFCKDRHPTLWGLDLWSPALLRKGLELQANWSFLVESLNMYLASSQSIPNIPGLGETIQVLQDAKYSSWPKKTASDCVDILFDNTVYQHGLIPQAVFQQILYPVSPQWNPPLPSDILKRFENLLTVSNFAVYGFSTVDVISPEIIAIRAEPHSLMRLQNTDFFFVLRSAAVWEQLQQHLSKTSVTQIKETFLYLRAVAVGAVLAGHIFAGYALNRMRQYSHRFPFEPMTHHPSSNSSSPLFTPHPDEIWDGTMDVEGQNETKGPVPHFVRPVFMPTRGRTLQTWDEQNYERGEPNTLLAWGRVIFVPVPTHQALFDAFFLDVPDEANPLIRVLWVIQFTTRRSSSEGFLRVRQLMRQAGHKQDMEGSGSIIDVEVRWVLVTPRATDKSEREWQMPLGWHKNTLDEDHRGSVWLLEMDFM